MPTLAIMGNDADRVLHVSHRTAAGEMAAGDTHGTADLSPNRLVLDSTGLGWRDAYTSLTSESSWSATLPALPHLSLAYCVRRSARIRRRVDGSRDEVTDLGPRRFGMIPADRSSTWHVDGDPEVQLVYLRRETIDELAIDAFEADPAGVEVEPRLGFGDPVLEPLVLSLLDAARNAVALPSSAVWADHVVRMIGLELLQRYSNLAGRVPSGSDLTRARVATTCEYVDANLTGDLSLRGIATAVQVRPHRLARDFRDRTGVPLHQYVLGRRVDRAAQLLRRSDTPVALVAIECGFADQSHLTTAFRRRVGVTPAVYRGA
jgi:AraC family transcriptional regulator